MSRNRIAALAAPGAISGTIGVAAADNGSGISEPSWDSPLRGLVISITGELYLGVSI